MLIVVETIDGKTVVAENEHTLDELLEGAGIRRYTLYPTLDQSAPAIAPPLP